MSKIASCNRRVGQRINGKPSFTVGDTIWTDTVRYTCVDIRRDKTLEWFVDCLVCKTRVTVETSPEDRTRVHTCQTCRDTESATPIKPPRRRRLRRAVA